MATTANRPSGERRRGLSKNLTKGLLLCWAIAIVEIWFAAEESDELFDPQHRHRQHEDDPEYNLRQAGFGEPEREERVVKELYADVPDMTSFSSLDANDNNSVTNEFSARGGIEEGVPERNIPREGIDDSENGRTLGDMQLTAADKSVITDLGTNSVSPTDLIETIGEKMTTLHSLPKALEPITLDLCCIPASNIQNPKDVRCFGTCFTERACNDTTYPFSSAEEKALYPKANLTKEYKSKLRKECMRLDVSDPNTLAPPMEWCQPPNAVQVGNDETIPYHVRNIPPAGCSHVSSSGGSGAFQNVLIFPSAKLALCGIPKVGITQWIQFLRFVFGAKDYPSWPHAKLDFENFKFDKLDPLVQKKIWEDDEWTFAAFIRDPAERVLSAFLDKFDAKSGETHMRKIFGVNGKFTLEDFIERLLKPTNGTTCAEAGLHGLSWCSDPHWRPQVFSCGLSERLDRFQFVGDIHNSADQTHDLLETVGLWESHGKHFVNGGIKQNHQCQIKPILSDGDTVDKKPRHIGFQQEDMQRNTSAANTAYGHFKGSKSKMDEHYTPELLRIVREELYAADYKLWNMVKEKSKMSNGKDLAAQLSPKCSKSLSPERVDESEIGRTLINIHSNASNVDMASKSAAKDSSILHLDVKNNATNETPVTQNSNSLPDALLPISFNSCCMPAGYSTHHKDVDCFGTCFSKKACNDTTYPYSSSEEKALYPMANMTEHFKKELKDECLSPTTLVPPMEWCQNPNNVQAGTNTTSLSYHIHNIPPMGCSHVSNSGGSGAFQNMLIFPSAKLALCGIPKVGITQWIQFLRFVAGAKDYPSLPHYKRDVSFFRFDKLDPLAQKRIWEDEEWKFAVFLRDPAERLLSAYLDKILKNKALVDEIGSNGTIAFEQFVARLSQTFNGPSCKTPNLNGLSWCSDPHWRPQVFSCGLSERLDRFQFVGDIHNSADQTRDLLETVGLWESHGKHFVNGGTMHERNMCKIKPILSDGDTVDKKPRHIGFQQEDIHRKTSAANTAYGHFKGSKSKMNEHYTPELLRIVREELYAADYKLWNMVKEKSKMLDGKGLAAQLSTKCSSVSFQ